MAKVIAQFTSEGVHLSPEELRQAGMEQGALLEIAVKPLPGPREIVARALRYCARKIGDAIGVGEPQWTGNEWEAPLYAPGGEVRIGILYLDAEGEVIGSKAPTQEALLEAWNAARSAVPAA
jgi:hypothetical protein